MQIEPNWDIFFQKFSDKKRCGCYCKRIGEVMNAPARHHAALPLKHIDYQVQITNGLVSVTLEQKYINPTDKFLEIEFSFPIDPNASIYRYIAQFGGKRVQGIVKQKQQAKKQYNQAIKSGKQASYAQIDPNSKDIMNMQIGNIGPREQVKIIISYLQELNIEQNTFYQFHLPSTISPRYMMNFNDGKNIRKKVDPNTKIAQGLYTWTFKVVIQTTKKIIFHQSISHKLQTLSVNEKGNQIVLVLPQEQIPHKDFHLLYTTQDFHLPNYVLGTTDISSTVMLSFIPKFCELNVDDAMKASLSKKQMQTDINAAKGEYIFFLDRSGSMGGSRINKAKSALILFLQSLPQNTYFNVISFGSHSQKLFGQSIKFDKKNLQTAIKKIEKMSADLGGTQIYNCLSSQLGRKVIQGYPKQLFLLTDGQVDNTQGVINLVQRNIKYSRCHSIGIGNGCSQALIKGCAQKGKGKYIFISDDQNPSEKIIGLLEETLTPVIDKVYLKYDKKIVQSIVPNPDSIPYILKNEVVNFYVTFKGKIENKTQFKFSYEDSCNKTLYESQMEIDPNSEITNMPFVDKMAHCKIIKNLQNAAKNNVNIEELMYYVKVTDKKAQAIKHSVNHQILSEYTAFICVDTELVDGKYQEIKDKGTEKVKIQNLSPLAQQSMLLEQLELKSADLVNSSLSFKKSSTRGMMAPRMRAPQMMAPQMMQMKSIPPPAQDKKILSAKSAAVKKKSTGGFGDFFGSIGSSISNAVSSVFTRDQNNTRGGRGGSNLPQARNNSMQVQGLSMQKQSLSRGKYQSSDQQQCQRQQGCAMMMQQDCDDMIISSQLKSNIKMMDLCENIQIKNQNCKMDLLLDFIMDEQKQQDQKSKKKKKKQNEKEKQKIETNTSSTKVIKYSINDVIKEQNSNGGFDSVKLIEQLITKEQWNNAVNQAKGQNINAVEVLISYLVGRWIEKNYKQKQYALIIKKAFSFIKKNHKLENLVFLDKYIL